MSHYSREPSFNAPTSEHTLLHLQETIGWALYKATDLGPGADTEQLALRIAIAIDMHTRQLIKETKHD
jgi:hypothetical protein